MSDLKNDASEYRLNTEQLDTLRLELQTATPEQLKEFNDVVALAHELFLKKFVHLFPKKAIIPEKRLEKTFILTDEETFKAFQETMDLPSYFDEKKTEKIRTRIQRSLENYFKNKNVQAKENITPEHMKEWFNLHSETEKENIRRAFAINPETQIHTYLAEDETGVFRAYVNKGRFVIGMAKEYWDDQSEELKAAARKLTDNEEEAKKLATQAYWLKQSLHELVHLYQKGGADPNIPLWLYELQAVWASKELVPSIVAITSPLDQKRTDFFQQLVDTYGDEVHKLIFHTQPDAKPEILEAIKKKFTSEVQKELYPHYRVINAIL